MGDPWGVVTVNAPVRSGSARWIEYHHDYVRPNATLVGCQESPNRADEFAKAYDPTKTGWAMVHSNPINDPILVDTSVWKILQNSVHRISSTHHLNDGGAGNTLLGKYVHSVLVEHRAESRKVRFYNNHFPASIQLGGVRDAVSEHFASELANSIRLSPDTTITVGDMNAPWDHSNFQPLRAAGLINASPPGGTHGNRAIDIIAYRSAKNAKSGERLLREGGKVLPRVIPDDHSGVAVTFRFPGAGEPPPDPDPEKPPCDGCGCD